MTWQIPPRRFPHGSYSDAPINLQPIEGNMPERYDPTAIERALQDIAQRDAKIADALLTFHRALSAGLDWLTEQFGSAFVGVTLLNQRGQLTIADANASGIAIFPTEEVDTDYSVFLNAIGFNGAPVTDAFIVKFITKATTGITVGLLAAPGSGTNVVFDYVVAREIVR